MPITLVLGRLARRTMMFEDSLGCLAGKLQRG